jgi:hypothetical protein
VALFRSQNSTLPNNLWDDETSAKLNPIDLQQKASDIS